MVLNIILTYSAFETIPKSLWNNNIIKKYCKKRKKHPKNCILDINKHLEAMKILKEWWMRGRPDIVHIFMINALDSILNREGKLRIFIHTRNDEIIYISPETRIPRNYNRFIGLMEDLFERKYIPDKENWLLKIEKKKLGQLIREESFDLTILMWEKGEFRKPKEIARELIEYNNPAVLIGGFQKGDFPEWIHKLVNKGYCIYKESLPAEIVLNEIIVNYENLIL